MKKFKKYLALLMAGLLISASLVACNTDAPDDDDDEDEDEDKIVDVTTTDENDNDPDDTPAPDVTTTVKEENPDDDPPVVTEKTLDELIDDMKAADWLTVKIDEDGFIIELVYDGNKIKEVISDGSDSMTYYYEVGDECLAYMELEGTWYYAPVDEAEVVTVEWLTELIPELLNIEIEEAGDAYVITAEDENGVASTITVEFKGSVTIPEDAVSAD